LWHQGGDAELLANLSAKKIYAHRRLREIQRIPANGSLFYGGRMDLPLIE
jgi:hypothetical protein